MYDLPSGKIEHGENHLAGLKREIIEELGLMEEDFVIDGLISVEEDFVTHIWNGEEKDEHLIGRIYKGRILKDIIDMSYIENGGDAKGLILLSTNNIILPKTNILSKALEKVSLFS